MLIRMLQLVGLVAGRSFVVYIADVRLSVLCWLSWEFFRCMAYAGRVGSSVLAHGTAVPWGGLVFYFAG